MMDCTFYWFKVFLHYLNQIFIHLYYSVELLHRNHVVLSSIERNRMIVVVVRIVLEVMGGVFKGVWLDCAQGHLFVSQLLLLVFIIIVQNANYWSWRCLLVHYFMRKVVVGCLAASSIFFFVVAGSGHSALRLRFHSFEQAGVALRAAEGGFPGCGGDEGGGML